LPHGDRAAGSQSPGPLARQPAVIAAACAAAAATALLAIHALTPAPRISVQSTRRPAIASLSRAPAWSGSPDRRADLARARPPRASFTALVPPSLDGAYLGRDVPGGRVSLFAGRLLITDFRVPRSVHPVADRTRGHAS